MTCSAALVGFRGLLFLEALARELEGATVLRHGADDLIRRATGQPRFDLEGNRHLRSNLSGQISDHLVSDATGVAANAR